MTDRQLNNHNSLFFSFLYSEKKKNIQNKNLLPEGERHVSSKLSSIPSVFHPSIHQSNPFWLLSKLVLKIVKKMLMMMTMVRAEDFKQKTIKPPQKITRRR